MNSDSERERVRRLEENGLMTTLCPRWKGQLIFQISVNGYMSFATVLDQGPTIKVGPDMTDWPQEQDPAMIAPLLCKQQVSTFFDDWTVSGCPIMNMIMCTILLSLSDSVRRECGCEFWCLLPSDSPTVSVWKGRRTEHQPRKHTTELILLRFSDKGTGACLLCIS